MKVFIDKSAIESNIKNAERITGKPIALMFKDFYEYVYPCLDVKNNILSKHIDNSVCYSIGCASTQNNGSVISCFQEALKFHNDFGIKKFYIPINSLDNREGFGLYKATKMANVVRKMIPDAELTAMITSGCINEYFLPISFWNSMDNETRSAFNRWSLGGSFYLGHEEFFSFADEIRIGEYMLFGTIPFCEKNHLLGRNGITFKTRVLAVYPERDEFICDCGYSVCDIQNCSFLGFNKIKRASVDFVDSSSDYAIFKGCKGVEAGYELLFVPDYKSLVKLKNVEHGIV
ncbi:MAG: hypothetical protein PHH23_01645 [Paludibacteraceae bacterium]|nr:hypothetical protein [Paludibacteraceae bacterium]